MKFPISVRWAVAVLALVAIAVTVAVAASAKSSRPQAKFVLGVSNTLVGNGWREEMICAVKAQAAASGIVSKVIVADRNGGPAEQAADIRNLISPGANRDERPGGVRPPGRRGAVQAAGRKGQRRGEARNRGRPGGHRPPHRV